MWGVAGSATVSDMIGLPQQTKAVLFDLDGVLTPTALVHAAAWKEMFDGFLRSRFGDRYRPFDPVADYDEYVDGRARADGTRAFLASRGIELPEGSPDDPQDQPPGHETVAGLGNRKNQLVLRLMERDGVQPYEGSVRFARLAREEGLRLAVVSSSTNCHAVLVAAGIDDLFPVRIDGAVAEQRRLKGKPAPDTYLAAAEALHVAPAQAAVFEDALAGVEAGRAGGFGRVVGVDRVGQADELRRHGADLVVTDLAELIEDG